MDEKEIEFDEDGIEKPQGYLFGKIPYYSGVYSGMKFWQICLLVAPLAIVIALLD